MEIIKEFNELKWKIAEMENQEKADLELIRDNEKLLFKFQNSYCNKIFFTETRIILAKSMTSGGFVYWNKFVIKPDSLSFYSMSDKLDGQILNSTIIICFPIIGELKIVSSQPFDYKTTSLLRDFENLFIENFM